MSKNVVLFDYLERKKKSGAVIINLGDGADPVTVPPAELWADEVYDTAAAGKTKDAVVMLLGQEASDRFHAAGGNWRVLNGLMRQQLGLDMGESGASSES